MNVTSKFTKSLKENKTRRCMNDYFWEIGYFSYMGFSAKWSYTQERRMESVTQLFLILEDNDKNSLDKKNRSSWDRQE